MKVFIGWSGQQSQAMALALREWLPLVLHYVEPWLSEKDIAAGERWAEAIAKELEASNFGILCITRENLASPWIVFEAGSLAKSLSSARVIPLLLDLEFSEISGPLAQFQAKKVDEEGMGEVIESINRAAQQPVQDARAKQLFNALWPDLHKKLKGIPAPKEPVKPIRSQHQILEELVASVRSLEARLREVAEIASSPRSARSRRFGRMRPMMLHEMADMTGAKPGDPLLLLMFASLFRDELPWLYELASEAYRAARSGNQAEARNLLDRFRRASRFVMEGPFAEELGIEPYVLHLLYYTLREIEHVTQTEEPEVEDQPEAKPRRKKEPKE
jgi:hypothetical protein